MTRFAIDPTPLAGLVVVERHPVGDHRGSFARLFCAEELAAAGFSRPVAQANHSLTRPVGAVRGLHFQYPPHAETKLVSCIRGRVFDVAVDLRRGSGTLLRWHGEELSAGNGRALLIPPGFAHGFQVLEPDSELIYLHDAPYAPLAEGAIQVQDPRLGIRWPLPIGEISDRDRTHPFLSPDFGGIAP